MQAFRTRDPLLYRALLASLAVHLVLALFFPALAVVDGTGPSIETISFTHVIPITITTPRPVVREQRALAPVIAAVPVVSPPVRVERNHPRAAQSAAIIARPAIAPVRGEPPRNGSPHIQAPRREDAPSAATPAPANVSGDAQTKEFTGGYMPLGAEETSPVLASDARHALAALGVHVTLTVVVDSNGHVKSVTYDPVPDAATQSQIQKILATATWDPAVCGAGVPCEGLTTIKL